MSEIFNLKKLYRAYYECRKNKRGTVNAIKFEMDLENNISNLLKKLLERSYRPGRSICFAVENPTIREIFAADFADRVIHHLLVNEIIAMGERRFIDCSFACRAGKGTHKAVAKLKSFMRKASENGNKETFYAQLDISGFFMAINHNTLYNILEKMILNQKKSKEWKDEILWLAKTIIFHKPTENFVTKGNPALFKKIPPRKSLFHSPPESGLPIGNYSSQVFANLYLNELDQFMKRKLKVKYYVRYVDDLIILDHDPEKLAELQERTDDFLKKKLGLSLSRKKTKLQNIKRGIDFLGYFLKPKGILVRQRVVKVAREKIKKLRDNKEIIAAGKNSKDKVLPIVNSYYGHFRHAISFRLREKLYDYHFGKLKESFQLSENKLVVEVRE